MKRSNTLAVMIPHVDNPYFPNLLPPFRVRPAGRAWMSSSTTPMTILSWKGLLNVLVPRGVDGLITQTYQLTADDLDRLIEAGVSVVVHGDEPTHAFADNLMIQESQAVERLVTYLIEKGHCRIGTIAGSQAKWTGRVRLAGYKNALEAHNLPVREELIYEVDYARGNGALAMQFLLRLEEPPTAVFAANDLLAVDALLYAVDSGLRVPQDVAIAGFDDIFEASIVRPRLTTVRKDVKRMGATAARMLLERIDSDLLLPARQCVLDYEIVCRESA